MSSKVAVVALLAVVSCACSGYGQELTEKYIPVGTYPELAGKYTRVGTIVSVEEQKKVFTLRVDGDLQTYEVTDRTKIWLDRSLLDKTHLDGNLSNLESGLKAEVGVVGPEQMHIAKWVKVQIESTP